MSSDDLVGVFRNGNHPSCVDSWTNGSGVPCDLCAERLNAADELQQLRAEVERLRAAGDALATNYELMLEQDWSSFLEAFLHAWKEARRG